MKLASIKNRFPAALIVILVVLSITSCAMRQPLQPNQIIPPTPRLDNEGAYLCPYTQDGVAAEWVDKAINAKMGATIGKHAGTFIGQKALENIPFVGGFLGSMAGEATGRAIAIKASGGWDYIKSTSDSSFDNVNDLSVYIYATHSTNEHFQEVLEATMEIYPGLKKGYYNAILNAPAK
ncbi:MAG: hypothetical protein Q7J15_08770 [Candidatus Desulfaltia sp.]|nr:hypothetical protein [Candidatus Desulfaltia sp.]